MEYWAQNLDWSRLRRLRLYDSSVPLAADLAPQLTALDEIELSSDYDGDNMNIPAFFNNLPSTLASVSLPSVPTSGLSTLTAHAARLHTLSIHTSPLTNQDLSLLRDALPLLKTLTVVCTRDAGTWPHDTLSILASFPRLQSLTIWFPIGPADAPHEPYLTLSSASRLFTELRERGASKLWRLRVHSGFKPRPFLGFPADSAYWWGHNVTSFVCQGHGDDGHAPRVTRCLKLSREQNERLRRVSRGERMKKEEENHIEFLVALRGPMTMDNYLNWRKERGRYY
ncbi:hypothetical protein C8A01DRAFT_42180 [Parachaetomium inaequale]|uniref:Uncharacterized protein n=1 Tax=Parachaetomium inaequale TaxID=2588326 RepID=A0AAN6P5V7_9PEZI|nr:hypothetical protein C8A01DRAFT_42180 [Parachaetomium inaequale]